MEYLKVRGLHTLKTINPKEFHYPSLSYYKGLETDYWDRPEVLQVQSSEPYGKPRIMVYYNDSHVNAEEIRAEVDLWNADPKKYWNLEFIRLYEEQCAKLEQRLVDDAKLLKQSKKKLKKLQGKVA